MKKVYTNSDDLKLAFPSANFPLEFSQWDDWIKKTESENYSLTFYEEENVVAHLAIKNYTSSPGLCYLCFLCTSPEFRGRDFSRKILNLTYKFCFNKLNKRHLWLVVDEQNTIAYNLYLKEGFSIVDKKLAGVRLIKELRA